MPMTPGLDFDRSGLTSIPVSADAEPARAWYFYLLREDARVAEFCVAGAVGPNSVATRAPDGTMQRWPGYWRGDLLVFHAPDGYTEGQPVLWCYDRRLQLGGAMPRPELERRALGMRTGVLRP